MTSDSQKDAENEAEDRLDSMLLYGWHSPLTTKEDLLAELLYGVDFRTSEDTGAYEIEAQSQLEGQINLAFFCTTILSTHGVPVVMKNIAANLDKSQFNYRYILNGFDDNSIVFVDSNPSRRVLEFAGRREFVDFLRQEGITLDVIHSHSWHISDHFKPCNADRDPMSLETFLEELGRPKLVYTDHSNPTGDLRKINKKFGVGYAKLGDRLQFLREHGADSPECRLKTWDIVSILCKRQLMELSDAVTFVSGKQMEEEQGMIPGFNDTYKSRVVLNGVDIGEYNTQETHELAETIRHRFGIRDDEKVLLYAGRLFDKTKGVYDLAFAAQKLQEQGYKIVLIYQGSQDLVFEDAKLKHLKKFGLRPEEFKGAIERCRQYKDGCTDFMRQIKDAAPDVRVIFRERIDRKHRQEMAAMYALADVVVQPTWGECFNQVAAESLAMGTPVVVSDISATGEIYVASGVAEGCKIQNPDDLARAVKNVLDNQALCDERRERGYRLVSDSLSSKAMGDNYAALYRELCASPREVVCAR